MTNVNLIAKRNKNKSQTARFKAKRLNGPIVLDLSIAHDEYDECDESQECAKRSMNQRFMLARDSWAGCP